MLASRRAILLTCLTMFPLGACGTYSGGPWQTDQGQVQTIRTEADSRLVLVSRPREVSDTGVVAPAQISCAEPSPDVARAVQTAAGLATSATADVTDPRTGLTAEGQLSISSSRSRAEAVAQLAERLATVQLLRDVLFRACEAYANGALGSISYAMMLSRLGGVMVTLLGSEMAAGAFGRDLAAIGGSADADVVGAAGRPALNAAAEQQARQRVTDARTVLAGAQRAVSEARQVLVQMPAEDPRRPDQQRVIQGTEAEAQTAQNALTAAERELRGAGTTAVRSNADARALREGGAIQGRQASTPPMIGAQDVIARMQRTYFDEPDQTPLALACITALQRAREYTVPPPDRVSVDSAARSVMITAYTRLARLCEGEQGLLSRVIGAAGAQSAATARLRLVEVGVELARASQGMDAQAQRRLAAAYERQLNLAADAEIRARGQ